MLQGAAVIMDAPVPTARRETKQVANSSQRRFSFLITHLNHHFTIDTL
jgi:hypothetical protein